MDKQLIVIGGDNSSFLEKTIRFGVEHNLITTERREQFVREGVDAYPHICRKLFLNDRDMGEAVQAGQVVLNLVSIDLERESQGDMARACAYFSASSLASILEKELKLIQDGVDRIQSLIRKAKQLYHVKFDYFVTIWKIKYEGFIIKYENCLAKRAYLVAFLKELNNNQQLNAWFSEIEDKEYEYEVSAAYLPWGQLMEEAGARSVFADKDQTRVIQGFILQDHLFQGEWSSETLLATMAVTWVCGGSFRRVGTVVNGPFLKSVQNRMRHPDNFRRIAQEKFDDYFSGKYRGDPYPDQRAGELLLKIFGCALDKLLYGAPKQLSRFSLLTWAHRVHLDAPGDQIQQHVLHNMDKAANPQGRKAVSLLAKIRDSELTPQRIGGLLRFARWVNVSKADLLEIMKIVPPETLVRHLGMTAVFAERVTEVWSQIWTAEYRRAYIDRLLKSAEDELWNDLEDVGFSRLQDAATPEQSRELRKRRSRHFGQE